MYAGLATPCPLSCFSHTQDIPREWGTVCPQLSLLQAMPERRG